MHSPARLKARPLALRHAHRYLTTTDPPIDLPSVDWMIRALAMHPQTRGPPPHASQVLRLSGADPLV